MAGLQVVRVLLDEYTETGDIRALTYHSQKYESFVASLGLKATTYYMTGDSFNATLQLHGRWLHEFGDTVSSVDAHFSNFPESNFTVRDSGIDRDSALLGCGLCFQLPDAMRVQFDYALRFNSDETIHVLSGYFQSRW